MNTLKPLACAAVLLWVTCGSSLAQVDDGFGSAKKISGRHFTLYCASGADTSLLASKMNIRVSDELMSSRHSGVDISGMTDTLFRQVCDILDMQLYSFEGKIKICADDIQLERIYRTLFGKSIRGKKSFYVLESNTIYITADNFRREILGHEMAHAVICRYFAVPPPVKVQEVLATYVEYQLRKSGQQ